MKLENIERKRKQINRGVYGLLFMAVIVFILILSVIQLQNKERLKRDKHISDYHLVISEKSLELLSAINNFRMWFRDYDLDHNRRVGALNAESILTPIDMALSGQDQIDAFIYEIDKHAAEIGVIQMQYGEAEFSAISVLLEKSQLKVKSGLKELLLNNSYSSESIDNVVESLASVAHQMQLLHQHAYKKMRISSGDFQREKRNQFMLIIFVFAMIGLFGVMKMLAVVQRTLSSLIKIQHTLHQQSMIINQIHDSVISTDLNGFIVTWNKGSENMFGHTVGEILGKHISTIYPEDEHAFLQNEVIVPLLQKREHDVEVRMQHKSGDVFFAHLSLSMLYDDQGIATGMIGYSMDITERRLAEVALQNSEERYRHLIEATSSIIWYTDKSGGFIVPQNSWEKYTGQPWNEYKDFGWTKKIHPDDIEHILMAWEKACQEISLYESSGRIWNAGLKEWRDFEVRAVPVKNKDGSLREWIGVITDIADKNEAKQDLINQKNRAQHYLDIVGVMLVAINSEGKVTLINRKGCEVLGYEEENIIDSNWFDNYLPKRLIAEVRGVFSSLMLGEIESVEFYEAFVLNRNGEEKLIAWHNSVLHDAEGKIIGTLSSGTDITDAKAAEVELNKHQYKLEELIEDRTRELQDVHDELIRKERLATLGQLTATVSHELRNPLGAMKPSLYVIEKKSDKSDVRVQQAIERIDRNVDRCDRIIDELLDFTRITELDRHVAPVDEWLESVITEQDIPKDIRVEKDFSLSGVELAIDVGRLSRAVINVVENACHAMLDDNKQVMDRKSACLNIKTQRNNKRIDIVISDTGSGMPEDVLQRIFEPLFSTRGFGVGLGMPTVKQIMEQHGGGVDIKSKEGEGTTVILWLPVDIVKKENGVS